MDAKANIRMKVTGEEAVHMGPQRDSVDFSLIAKGKLSLTVSRYLCQAT